MIQEGYTGNKYDIVVIGGGVAGCEAAMLASEQGFKVAVVEKDKIGGVCLNSGCIPSKTYLASAHRIDRRYDFDYKKIYEQKNKVVELLRNGMIARLNGFGVDIIYGYGEYTNDNDNISVNVTGQNPVSVQCDKLIIATGSKTATEYFDGIEDEISDGFVCTNQELFEMEDLPHSMVIVGGGVSGVEMADCFASFGTKVTILEKQDEILSGNDIDIVAACRKMLNREGIDIITSVDIEEICEGTVFYNDSQGNGNEIMCDRVYLCTGRKSVRDICEELPLRDSTQFQIKNNNIFVIGDAAGGIMLAHKAMEDAKRIVSLIIADDCYADLDDNKNILIPKSIYTSVEFAEVGISDNGHLDYDQYSVEKVSMNYSGRYVADNGGMDNTGFMKLIFDKNHRLTGACVASNYACELVGIFEILIKEKKRAEDILNYILPHPTEGEIIKTCARQYLQKCKESV